MADKEEFLFEEEDDFPLPEGGGSPIAPPDFEEGGEVPPPQEELSGAIIAPDSAADYPGWGRFLVHRQPQSKPPPPPTPPPEETGDRCSAARGLSSRHAREHAGSDPDQHSTALRSSRRRGHGGRFNSVPAGDCACANANANDEEPCAGQTGSVSVAG